MELQRACDLSLSTRWAGMRKAPTYAGWCGDIVALWPDKTLDTLTAADVRTYVELLKVDGLEPATIYARVSHLNTIYTVAKENGYRGNVPEPMPYPRVPRKLKWWLNPDTQKEALAWCENTQCSDLSDFIPWTCSTGLRVEETLACQRCHLFGDGTLGGSRSYWLSVPGSKTEIAQAALPLSQRSADIALRRMPSWAPPHTPLFSTTYLELWSMWERCRDALGLSKTPGATLKALRRTYARERSAKGVPLPVLQQMMRHRDPGTTLEYLRLTGGAFTLEEMQRWA